MYCHFAQKSFENCNLSLLKLSREGYTLYNSKDDYSFVFIDYAPRIMLGPLLQLGQLILTKILCGTLVVVAVV